MRTAGRLTAPFVIVAVLSASLIQSGAAKPSKSDELQRGEKTYMASCEACHMQGKNVIKPGKDIVVSTKISTLGEFKEFLSEKHGLMPSFKSIASDDPVVRALHAYVKTLKNQDWQYEPAGIEKTPEEPSGKDSGKQKKPGQASQNPAGS